MSVKLEIAPEMMRPLWAHLLLGDVSIEKGAFVLCNHRRHAATEVFSAVERFPMSTQDIACAQHDYLELSDACRARLIKRAHDTGLCPLEFHSHLGGDPPAFSIADKCGFEDFVPHIRWRLGNRPYAAIVVSRGGFDGLVWSGVGHDPEALDSIRTGGRIMRPTQLTLPYWRSCNVRRSI